MPYMLNLSQVLFASVEWQFVIISFLQYFMFHFENTFLSLVLPNKLFTVIGSVAGKEETVAKEVYLFLPISQDICACRQIHAFTERF